MNANVLIETENLSNLHISKLVEEQELRLQYQRRSLELKTEYRMKRELLECIISCTEEGRLVLSICDGDRVVKSKHLINAVDYSSIRYFTTYPMFPWMVTQISYLLTALAMCSIRER